MRIVLYILFISVAFSQRIEIDTLIYKDVITSVPYFINVHKGKVFFSFWKENRFVVYDFNGKKIETVKGTEKQEFYPYCVYQTKEGYISFSPNAFHTIRNKNILKQKIKRTFLFHFYGAFSSNIFLEDTLVYLPILYSKEPKYYKRIHNEEHRKQIKTLSLVSIGDSPQVISRIGEWDIFSYYYSLRGKKGLWMRYFVDTLRNKITVSYKYSPFVYIYDTSGHCDSVVFMGLENDFYRYLCREDYFVSREVRTACEAELNVSKYGAVFSDKKHIYRIVYPAYSYSQKADSLYRFPSRFSCNTLTYADMETLREIGETAVTGIIIYDTVKRSLTKIILPGFLHFAGNEDNSIYFYDESYEGATMYINLYRVRLYN